MAKWIPVVVIMWFMIMFVTMQRFPNMTHIIIPVMSAAMAVNITVLLINNR